MRVGSAKGGEAAYATEGGADVDCDDKGAGETAVRFPIFCGGLHGTTPDGRWREKSGGGRVDGSCID